MRTFGPRKKIVFGVTLVVLSAIVYYFHFLIFEDVHHIFLYMIGDVAFVFIEVLLVTLIIHQLLEQREKRAMFSKLNMVIGAFFSEVGTPLLRYFVAFDPQYEKLSEQLAVDKQWSPEQFEQLSSALQNHGYEVAGKKGNLAGLQQFLVSKKEFLLRLLENPNLLEHEYFTELLWAVFHLADELSHRKNIEKLPETDYKHLAGDIKRAYGLLVREWLSYMQHLSRRYPYLFSLAVRTNPFNPGVSVEVK